MTRHDPISQGSCRRCGVPLAYDAFLTGLGSPKPAETLCSYCASGVSLPRVPAGEDNSWILDLIMKIYQSNGGWQRLAARLCSQLPWLPARWLTLARVIDSIPRRRAQSRFDAIILYSGGKDSSYMLVHLARSGLRLCAWMLDQGYQSPTALTNARRLCERLGVPLEIEKPEGRRMNDLFRLGFGISQEDRPELVRAAMTYGSACWPCFATIAARSSAFCAAHDVAFCFIGTQRGQNRLDLHGRPALAGRGLPRMDDLTRKFIQPLRAHANTHCPSTSGLLAESPARAVVLPFYEFVPRPAREQQLRALQEVGWVMPSNVGACSSNCMMNELGRQVMRFRFGFDLYQVIDAHERRMNHEIMPPEGLCQPPVLDEQAVVRAARMMGMREEEARLYQINLSQKGTSGEPEPAPGPQRPGLAGSEKLLGPKP